MRRVAPIRDGRVTGPGLTGTLLDAGADFQRYPTADVAHLEANYVLELDDGHRVLMEGQIVDTARIYFRCAPQLSADESSLYARLNRTLFVGVGELRPNGVRIDVFRVQ